MISFRKTFLFEFLMLFFFLSLVSIFWLIFFIVACRIELLSQILDRFLLLKQLRRIIIKNMWRITLDNFILIFFSLRCSWEKRKLRRNSRAHFVACVVVVVHTLEKRRLDSWNRGLMWVLTLKFLFILLPTRWSFHSFKFWIQHGNWC